MRSGCLCVWINQRMFVWAEMKDLDVDTNGRLISNKDGLAIEGKRHRNVIHLKYWSNCLIHVIAVCIKMSVTQSSSWRKHLFRCVNEKLYVTWLVIVIICGLVGFINVHKRSFEQNNQRRKYVAKSEFAIYAWISIRNLLM